MSDFIQLWESIKNKHNINSSVQCGGNVSNDSVLIIVDTQNCSTPIYTNTTDIIDVAALTDAIRQVEEIEKLIDNNKRIVFTKNYYPVDHISNTSGCTNNESEPGSNNPTIIKCINTVIDICKKIKNPDKKNQKIITFFEKIKSNMKQKYIKLILKGIDISYLFAGTKYYDAYFELLNENQVLNNKSNTNNILKYEKKKTYDQISANDKTKIFLQLAKNELGDMKSYSAFNYHIELEYMDKNHVNNNYEVISTPIVCDKTQSTGLCEYLEYLCDINYNNANNAKIDKIFENPIITVCGDDSELSVAHTVCQGSVMTKLYKNKNLKMSKFIYSIAGTRWKIETDEFSIFSDDEHILEIGELAINTVFLNDQILNKYLLNAVIFYELTNIINRKISGTRTELFDNIEVAISNNVYSENLNELSNQIMTILKTENLNDETSTTIKTNIENTLKQQNLDDLISKKSKLEISIDHKNKKIKITIPSNFNKTEFDNLQEYSNILRAKREELNNEISKQINNRYNTFDEELTNFVKKNYVGNALKAKVTTSHKNFNKDIDILYEKTKKPLAERDPSLVDTIARRSAIINEVFLVVNLPQEIVQTPVATTEQTQQMLPNKPVNVQPLVLTTSTGKSCNSQNLNDWEKKNCWIKNRDFTHPNEDETIRYTALLEEKTKKSTDANGLISLKQSMKTGQDDILSDPKSAQPRTLRKINQ